MSENNIIALALRFLIKGEWRRVDSHSRGGAQSYKLKPAERKKKLARVDCRFFEEQEGLKT